MAAVLALCCAAAAPDPLAGAIGNTILCRGSDRAEIFHLWLGEDGGFVLLAGIPVRTGRFSAARLDGRRIEICLHPAPAPVLPEALARPAPAVGLDTPLCLILEPHRIGDRWHDRLRPGASYELLAGLQ